MKDKFILNVILPHILSNFLVTKILRALFTYKSYNTIKK